MARTAPKTKQKPVPAVGIVPPDVQAVAQAEPEKSDAATRSLDLVAQMRRIAPEDWGTRATVYLYRKEPITDRLTSGNFVFIMKYEEPIDVDKILIDHGSGKYKAILTFRKPEEDKGDKVASAVFEILNVNFPPKIPPGEWVDDPRNKKWAWAKPLILQPQAQQAAANGAGDILNAVRLGNEMAGAATPDTQGQPSMLEIIKTVKEMMPAPAPATDNKMLDTVVALLTAQMTRDQNEAAELRKEIREMHNKPAPAASSGLGSLKGILAEAKELGLLPEGGLKDLWKTAQGTLQAVTRSRMSGTEEFLQPILVSVAEAAKPLVPMLVSRMLMPKPPQPAQVPQQPQPNALPSPAAPPQPGQQPAPVAAQPANGAPAPPTTEAPAADFDQAFAFIKAFADPFVRWFKEGKGTGGDFAEWIFDAYGADWQGLKWLHMKSGVGVDTIVQIFRGSPFWPEIAAAELKFTEYVEQFVKWAPEAAQAVVDLDSEEQDETEAN
jgi:hypothetical protein